jgi:hypothetical protein
MAYLLHLSGKYLILLSLRRTFPAIPEFIDFLAQMPVFTAPALITLRASRVYWPRRSLSVLLTLNFLRVKFYVFIL